MLQPRSGLLLAVLAPLALIACGVAPQAGRPDAPAPRQTDAAAPRQAGATRVPDLSAYRLGIGDRVRIDVYGEPDLSLEAAVDPAGRISYPLLGSIPALKRTAREMQEYISEGLANGYLRNPDVRVNVVQYRPFYAIGQVQRSGAYPYVIGLTVEKALALAGGMTNLASARRIYLLREDAPADERVRVQLDDLVMPGDTLLVEESLF